MRYINALKGALIADAAAMGLHWIYDFAHLQRIAGDEPIFRAPDKTNYEGVFGFFAHEERHAGQLSHYGEAALLALSAFEGGHLDPRRFQAAFARHFGAGGRFIGYIDSPTRITLKRLAEDEEAAAAAARAAVDGVEAGVAKVVLQKVLPYTRRFSGEALIEPITRAIKLTYDAPEVLELALRMAQQIDGARRLDSGADDAQCPALQTLPAFFAHDEGPPGEARLAAFEAAVRVTNNRDEAVAYARFAYRLLHAYAASKSLDEATRASLDAPGVGPIKAHLEAQRAARYDTLEAAALGFGQACYLREAVPLALWIFEHSARFEEAVVMNTLAGGDSCGRALLLGPLAALRDGGVPAALEGRLWLPEIFEGLLPD